MKRISLILIIALALFKGAFAIFFFEQLSKSHQSQTSEELKKSITDNSSIAAFYSSTDNQIKDEAQDFRRLKTVTYRILSENTFQSLQQYSNQILRKYYIIQGIKSKRMSFLENDGYYLFYLRKLLI